MPGSVPRRYVKRDRAIIRARRSECGICGEAIDYSLPSSSEWSFVVDHIIPLVHTGPAGDKLANKQAAHKLCNAKKKDRLADGQRAGGQSSGNVAASTPTTEPNAPGWNAPYIQNTPAGRRWHRIATELYEAGEIRFPPPPLR